MATPARAVKVNRSGFPKKAYDGLPTTLCQGCGHNSITGQIITAYYELGISPYKIAKMSGIGCSSKAITYFIDSGHGFNGLHGRMARFFFPLLMGCEIEKSLPMEVIERKRHLFFFAKVM